MKFNRASGILLHPTSLPSQYGIGDMGSEAYAFVDMLNHTNQSLWQILPLGPVGYAESPYQCFSAFAGNTLLISIEKLITEGLLLEDDIPKGTEFSLDYVEFGKVIAFKQEMFEKAYNRFKQREEEQDFSKFVEKNRFWLEDFAFFMALKMHFGGIAWNHWDQDIAFREAAAMTHYKDSLADRIRFHQFLQYIFFKQWFELKEYANGCGIKIIGDLPIFISYDSSDAWAKPQCFELDEKGHPHKVAGVPPDYFSETGQLWGNPHYRWSVMEEDGFKWWKDRFEQLFKMVDIIRIDHFRGFESYWEIPGSEKTAKNGCWVKAPGEKLFDAILEQFGELPIIAEDLGLITPPVEALKNRYGFPGMKILQFTFGRGAEERFLPHNYEENAVVYTGTHDNDTTVGWFKKIAIEEPEAVEQLRNYFKMGDSMDAEEVVWRLVEAAFKSRASMAIIPMQDILGLDTEARMNIPNTIGGNWVWRYRKDHVRSDVLNRLKVLTLQYKRNQ